jgi:MOSC domain-containing protein YiiM
MITVTSIQIGSTAAHEYNGQQVPTACFKEPVAGPIHLGTLGLEGDQQADRVHHGGPDKAVLAYAAAHYPHWERFLGRAPGPAVLGENLTVAGVTEETVCIGDTYQLGSAVVQVSQPRVPCFKMNLRLNHAEVLKEIVRTGFSGFYLRVLQEGQVQNGDSFRLRSRPDGAPTIAFANRIFHHERGSQAALHRLLHAEGLAAQWIAWVQKQLAG